MSEWVSIISVGITALFSAGGIAAIFKARHDAKIGVREDSRADTDSLNARAIAIVETQFQFLVQPLQAQVESLRAEVTMMRKQTEAITNRYWKAVAHIRNLYSWIARHMPQEMENSPLPEPSADLAEDI